MNPSTKLKKNLRKEIKKIKVTLDKIKKGNFNLIEYEQLRKIFNLPIEEFDLEEEIGLMEAKEIPKMTNKQFDFSAAEDIDNLTDFSNDKIEIGDLGEKPQSKVSSQ